MKGEIGEEKKTRLAISNVSQEYAANAKPGEGTVYYDSDYKVNDDKNEIKNSKFYQ